ncbi:cytochrome P450 monooxygenase GliC2 [Lasiosphaeria ovina]|uniref:Cytochrome P450 monooxygenase GliC2 n=1 Tax=Lasiosphaeria ovina TaxID=92902 RepID=A0AAE0KBH5_9PEZI|nr:cytochrome P450 monooxygenase GliC2 [Lasiosphaeria ovina]
MKQTTTSWLLSTFNPGVLPGGKPVSGPKWQFPNGAILQRFIDGRASSESWRKYGAVYRIWSGPYPEIVITTPEDLKHFSTDASDHGKPHNMNLGWFLGEVLGKCLGLLGGNDWRRLRRIFDPAFTHSAAVARIDVVDRAARKYVAELPRMAAGTSTSTSHTGGDKDAPSSPFNLLAVEAFTKFPYFLTASAIYGPMTDAEERDLWRVTEKRIALAPCFLIGGPYRFALASRVFDRAAVRRMREYEREWRQYNSRMVQVRRARGDGKAPVVTYWEEYERGNMSLTELLHTLDELLMLNLDVITHVLTWFITLVADHEHIKRELCDEIAENQASVLEYLAKTDTHLHRCFTESMRVRPFAIFTPGEFSYSVKNFHGVLVKPGTQILVDVLAINVRNPFWGANSESFEPSRLKNIKPSELRYNLHSFGIGSRKCMGQYVAGHIVKALVVHLFGEFEVQVLDGRRQGGDGYDVDKSSWTPKAGASLRLTKRES